MDTLSLLSAGQEREPDVWLQGDGPPYSFLVPSLFHSPTLLPPLSSYPPSAQTPTPSLLLSTFLIGEERYSIVGSRFPRLPAQREPDTALLPSSPPRCSACERMAAFQNSFDSQSVTNVVLFEIYEDNMVSRRPEEQGAVKAVLDDRRFFFLPPC